MVGTTRFALKSIVAFTLPSFVVSIPHPKDVLPSDQLNAPFTEMSPASVIAVADRPVTFLSAQNMYTRLIS